MHPTAIPVMSIPSWPLAGDDTDSDSASSPSWTKSAPVYPPPAPATVLSIAFLHAAATADRSVWCAQPDRLIPSARTPAPAAARVPMTQGCGTPGHTAAARHNESMVQAAASARPLRILFVEDDPVIGEATLAHLERHRYQGVWVTDGLEAWERFTDPTSAPFDVVLCDVVLPGMDGVTLCRRVREIATTPFVLVSARSDAVDVVGGLEAGADDYVVKPFDIQVLLARLRSVVRRAEAVSTRAAAGHGTVERF